VLARSIGLTTLVGENENDLRRRWDRLRRWAPGGYLDSIRFETWRQRGLVGTPKEIRRRVQQWQGVGVSHIVCAFGMPFGIFDDEQLGLFAATW
jgi:alkanesulfonate monooxygenase SsuD/methylene tetrahydromethanopterin reductase-like flavin-dependent oxidoreductase (luciferase family)